jgi:glucose dehydrogenase
METMRMTRLKVAILLLFSVGVLSIGAFVHRAWTAPNEPVAQAEPPGTTPEAPQPVTIANGFVDTNTETAFVVNPAGGIDALDLKTGKVLWQTPKEETAWPLCVAGNRLVVRIRDGQGVRIAVLDATAQGRLLVKSEPLPFPGWAKPYHWLDPIATPGGPNASRQYESRSFISAERNNDGELVIEWKAHYSITRQPKFTSPPAYEQKQAAGTIRLDLKSGAIKVQEDAEAAVPNRTIAQVPVVEKFQMGDRDYAVVEVPNRERKLRATDRTSGKLLWEHPLRCQFRLPPRS